MSNALGLETVEKELLSLNGWSADGDTIAKTFVFENFREAVAFIVRISYECEEMDHHPDIRNTYKTVRLSLATHDAGGKVTERDIKLARRIEAVAAV
jgi:4a-hydroxytetrahydrobiopterin dehydratase